MPKLQVLNGKRQGEIFEIPHNTELVVGHRQSASISIDDPWVSWDHARVIYQPDSATCWIEDLGSTNGTYVNCVRVKREQLRHEDIIFLGKTHVIYLSPIAGDLFGLGSEDGTGKHTAVGTPAIDPAAAAAPPPFEDSSETGTPFSSTGALPPLAGLGKDDPFASRSSQNTVAPLWDPNQAKDPFSDSSVDPFSSGPDYAPGGDLTVRPNNNPFAETRGDEQPSPLGGVGKGRSILSLSSLGELDDMNLPGPSGEEISRLIEGGGSDPFRDLPGVPQRSTTKLPAIGDEGGDTTFPTGKRAPAADPFQNVRPSEMRTQPINTDAINQMLNEGKAPAPPAPPPPAPAPPAVVKAPGSAFGAADPGPPPNAPPPPPTPSSSGDPSAIAFEKARLEDEVQRLRLALQAVQEGNPQAVAAAARALRDEELGRMAQRIAQLERELAYERAEKQAREQELNMVTEEMIEKEDLIDSLRDQLGISASSSEQRAPAPSDLGPGLITPSSGDLPALSDSQDWSSLEF